MAQARTPTETEKRLFLLKEFDPTWGLCASNAYVPREAHGALEGQIRRLLTGPRMTSLIAVTGDDPRDMRGFLMRAGIDGARGAIAEARQMWWATDLSVLPPWSPDDEPFVVLVHNLAGHPLAPTFYNELHADGVHCVVVASALNAEWPVLRKVLDGRDEDDANSARLHRIPLTWTPADEKAREARLAQTMEAPL